MHTKNSPPTSHYVLDSRYRNPYTTLPLLPPLLPSLLPSLLPLGRSHHFLQHKIVTNRGPDGSFGMVAAADTRFGHLRSMMKEATRRAEVGSEISYSWTSRVLTI